MATDKECMKRWNDFGGKAGEFCRDCEERYIGCHGSCEKYRGAKERLEARKKQIAEARMHEKLYQTYKCQKITREKGK